MNKEITLESTEQIENWLDKFSYTYLVNNNLPIETVSIPDIPYTYHELYRELIRRDSINE